MSDSSNFSQLGIKQTREPYRYTQHSGCPLKLRHNTLDIYSLIYSTLHAQRGCMWRLTKYLLNTGQKFCPIHMTENRYHEGQDTPPPLPCLLCS